MNPLSGDLTFVDASGWIALVNANDTVWQMEGTRKFGNAFQTFREG